MRLIDADALSELLVKTYEKAPTENALLFVALLLKNNEQVPTVEPDRPQGQWIEHTERITLDTYYECSNCKEPWTTIEGTPWNNGMNYCPNCGASMKPKTCTNCETFGHDCGDCKVGDDD